MREELVHLWRLAHAARDRASDAALDERLEASSALAAERFPAGALDEDRVTLGDASPGARPRVIDVVVAGRTVVEKGELLTGDLAAIRAEARAAAPELWRRMEAISWPG